MPVNQYKPPLFVDREDPEPAKRGFTMHEASFVSFVAPSVIQPAIPNPPTFIAEDILTRVAAALHLPHPSKYRRAMNEFLLRLVSKGALTVVGDAPRFRSTRPPTIPEWDAGFGVLAYGIPFVAEVYQPLAVRIHGLDKKGEPRIGSGMVAGKRCVLTNAHVADLKDLQVSWGNRDAVGATAKTHPDGKLADLAVVYTEADLSCTPYPWPRAPRAGEQAVVLAYPYVPKVEDRPLLAFAGHVANPGPVKTYYGDENMLISVVMSPGASGGPIFSADGYFIGIAVQQLTGEALKDDKVEQSNFYAALASDVILRELPKIDPELKLNKWG